MRLPAPWLSWGHGFPKTDGELGRERRKNEMQKATVPIRIMNISRKKRVDFTDSSKLLMSNTIIVSSVMMPASWFLEQN